MKTKAHKYNIEGAEFVKMTKKEYMKLIERFGEADTSLAIEKLDNYKGSLGKRYKSDYRAILSWAMNAIKQNGSNITHPSDLTTIKDPDKLMAAKRELRKQGWKYKEVKISNGTTMKWTR